MKKILLTIVAFGSIVTGAMSQISMDMETWVADPAGSLQDPQGWASFNAASVAGMAQTIFKEHIFKMRIKCRSIIKTFKFQ